MDYFKIKNTRVSLDVLVEKSYVHEQAYMQRWATSL